MLKATVLFNVIAASFLIDQIVASQSFDIQNFLKSLQQQLKEDQGRQAPWKVNVYANDDDDDASYYGSLKKKDVDKVLYSSNNFKKSRSSLKQRKRSNAQKDLNVIDLNQIMKHRRPFRQPLKLVPDELVRLNEVEALPYDRSSGSGSDSREEAPSQYSKVFVVLNSEAIRKSKNKERLNALLSSLLSSPPTRNQRVRQRTRYSQNHRNRNRGRYNPQSRGSSINQYLDDYKGFILKSVEGRRANIRDSKEIYVKESVIESNPRPMRSRDRDNRPRGRSGGNTGGRTAIPYIRHRGGDIYERED